MLHVKHFIGQAKPNKHSSQMYRSLSKADFLYTRLCMFIDYQACL